jgi:DNA-binding NtrC family response regulator
VDVLREQIRALSRWPSVSVLLQGEPGTGKADVARALHEATGARGALAVLSAADSSVAVVDAALRKLGAPASAADGSIATLYIEGVEGLSAEAQRLIAEGLRVRRGSAAGDAGRLVTGSERRLAREDLLVDSLYAAIAEFPLRLPPLRERLRDIPDLVRAVLAGHGNGSAREHLAPGTIEQLQRLPWATNLEQLQAVVERARSMAVDGVIGHVEVVHAWEHLTGEHLPETARVGDTPLGLPVDGSPPRTLRQIERDAITSAFSLARGNVTLAAKRLGIPRSTLRDRLRRLGMR